jgi:dihydrofolate synthase/folylpolyglutamate synthase
MHSAAPAAFFVLQSLLEGFIYPLYFGANKPRWIRRVNFPDFAAVQEYLNSLINYEHAFPLGGSRDRPKLEPTYKATERLSLPLSLPHSVHIAGTKGKGSVVSFLESLLSPDHRVLAFTSPHLESVKERIRLNGELLPDAVWQKGFAEIVAGLAAEPAIKLTYFETTLIFYLWAARELKTDVHLIEAGLGGKWDATNVLEKTMAVLTPVDFDHTEVLGNTLTEIATDKSGIIKPGAAVVVGKQGFDALHVYEAVIAEQQAQADLFGYYYRWSYEEDECRFRYEDTERRITGLTLRVPGIHQRDNAATALRAAFRLFPDLNPDLARTRLAQCVVPGRQQLLPGQPDILLDVAHNPISFRALADTLNDQFEDRNILAVIGMAKTKDARSCFAALKDVVEDVLIVELNNPRSYQQVDLAVIARAEGFRVQCPANLNMAFEQLHQAGAHDLGLVTGSFYLAGDYLTWRRHAGIA